MGIDDPTYYTYQEIQEMIDNYIIYKTLPSSISNFNVSDVMKALLDYTQNNLSENPNVYNSAIPQGIAMSDQVGEIPSGTLIDNLNGVSLSRLFDMLLFKIIPTYVPPSVALYLNPTDILYIVGSQINFTGAMVFNQGQILQPWNNTPQGVRSGAALAYLLKLPTGSSYVNIGDPNFTYPFTIPEGISTFSSKANYDIGPIPTDINGNQLIPLPAGTVQATDLTIEGVYPIFASTTNLDTPDQQPLVSQVNTTEYEISLTAEIVGSAKQSFSLVREYSSLSSIEYKDPINLTYDGVDRSADFDLIRINRTINGNTIQYSVFTYNGPTRGAITIKLNY